MTPELQGVTKVPLKLLCSSIFRMLATSLFLIICVQSSFNRVPNETTVHIHLLAVRKKFRNCGIGTWLIEVYSYPLELKN